MICPKCGNQIAPNMKFCSKCGTPVVPVAPPVKETPKEFLQYANPNVKPPQINPQNVAVQQPVQKNNPKNAQEKKKKKNLPLIIVAIVLVIAVIASSIAVVPNLVKNNTEINNATEYIEDFPTLKQQTEFLVYDAEKFPSEKYEIKVERMLMGGIFNGAFKGETVIEDVSTEHVYNIDFKEDGDYRITLTDITAERTQATSEDNTEVIEIIIIIDVVVDNDAEDATDRVDLSGKAEENTTAGSDFIEATDSDFEELGEMLQSTIGTGYYGDDKSMDSIEELLCLLHSSSGRAYEYYYGEVEYKQYSSDILWAARVPKDNIKWICENIFNIEYKETLDYSGMKWDDGGCYFKDDYWYIYEWAATGFPQSEYELDSYKSINGKYEVIFDVYEEDWNGDHGSVYSGTVKVTAEIKIIDGERYWSIYKVEEYDPTKEPVTQTPASDETTTAAPKDMYDENAVMYNNYLKNGALNDLLSEDSGSMIGSGNYEISTCMIDINNDGTYELVLRIRDTDWNSTNDCLFSIVDGKVVMLEDRVGLSGGSAGGTMLNVKYDNVTKAHTVIIDGHGRSGYQQHYYYYRPIEFDGKTYKKDNLYYCVDYYCGENADYQDEIDKIKRETSKYHTYQDSDQSRLCAYTLNDKYISKDEYDKAITNRYSDPKDSKYEMKTGTFTNPLGL